MYKLVVLFALFADAAAAPSVLSPLGLGWRLVAPEAIPIIASIAAAPIVAASKYRGPLSFPPGLFANTLAANGRPLDTLSVNLNHAAHYTARAVENAGIHLLKKRATPWVANNETARIDDAIIVARAPLATTIPLGLANWRAPVTVLGRGVPLGRV